MSILQTENKYKCNYLLPLNDELNAKVSKQKCANIDKQKNKEVCCKNKKELSIMNTNMVY